MRAFAVGMCVVVFSGAAVLVGTAPRQSHPAATVVVALQGEPTTLNPVLSNEGDSLDVTLRMFSNLVKLDGNLQRVAPDLATSWEWSSDHRTLTFHLRQDASWHDGAPVTADDVLFTYRAITSDQVASPWRSLFDRVERAWTPDAHTFAVRYREPFAPALVSWWIGILPRHLLRGQDLNSAAFNRRPVGSGPFRFVSWRSGESIVLEANDTYYGGAPAVRRLVFRIVPEATMRTLELLSGQLDSTGISLSDWLTVRGDSRFRITRAPWPGFELVYYNLTKAPFDDIRVRRALTLAVDRRQLVDHLFGGLTTVACSPYPPGFPCRDETLKPLPYSPESANELLDRAGWLRPGKGRTRVHRLTGAPLRFTLLTGARFTEEELAAVYLQRAWARIGVDARVRKMEWSAFMSEHMMKGQFEAALVTFGLVPGDPDQSYAWHSAQKPPHGFNLGGYDNPKVDAALESGRREFVPARRAALYARVQRCIHEDQPVTFLWDGAGVGLVAVHRRFIGVNEGLAGPLDNIEHWRVEDR